MPPVRSTSKSSMLSAPAHIPAITLSSFGAGLAAPDLIRDVVIDTLSARICGSRVCSANPSSGTSPACDTRLSSSKRAEPAVNLCDTRTGSALLEPGRSVPRNTYRPSSRGTFLVHTPITNADRPRIQAKPPQRDWAYMSERCPPTCSAQHDAHDLGEPSML